VPIAFAYNESRSTSSCPHPLNAKGRPIAARAKDASLDAGRPVGKEVARLFQEIAQALDEPLPQDPNPTLAGTLESLGSWDLVQGLRSETPVLNPEIAGVPKTCCPL
jgi:hypothetical protein